MRIATNELIKVFGKQYLQDNYMNTCKAVGMVNQNTYQLFVGIKGSEDLSERKANEHGWVVFGKVFVDANTGKVVELEYELE